MNRLKNYEKDKIDPKYIARIKPFMRDNPEFKDINSFKAKSDAIYGLAKWCKALLDYHEALKEVRPR